MSGQLIAGPWSLPAGYAEGSYFCDPAGQERAARTRAAQALAEYDERRATADAREPVFWGEMAGLLSEVLRTWLDVSGAE